MSEQLPTIDKGKVYDRVLADRDRLRVEIAGLTEDRDALLERISAALSMALRLDNKLAQAMEERDALRAALVRIDGHIGVGFADIVMANTVLGRIRAEARSALSRPEEPA